MKPQTSPDTGDRSAAADGDFLVSYSAFDTWTRCPEKYRLTRIVGVSEDPAEWFAAGTAFHAACDHVDFALIAEGNPPF